MNGLEPSSTAVKGCLLNLLANSDVQQIRRPFEPFRIYGLNAIMLYHYVRGWNELCETNRGVIDSKGLRKFSSVDRLSSSFGQSRVRNSSMLSLAAPTEVLCVIR